MPRILGVDLPSDKPTHISLRYIDGIGPTRALEVDAPPVDLGRSGYRFVGPRAILELIDELSNAEGSSGRVGSTIVTNRPE